jgi:Collagen triple helix repeat (20 copies)
MLSRLREHFGSAGLIVAIVALIAALGGGAYAASNSGGGKATASAKGKQGPRGKTGKTGPAGPQGSAGPAGAKGDKGDAGAAGANGKDGTNGTNGKNAEAVTFTGVKGSCTEGGIEVKSASPIVLVCNGAKGADGSTGPQGPAFPVGGTLPVGETETGAFAAPVTYENEEAGLYLAFAPISFPIKLAAEIDGAHVEKIAIGETPPANCDDGAVPPPSPTNPEADSGYLCIFLGNDSAGFGTPSVFLVQVLNNASAGANKQGARMTLATTTTEGSPDVISGTWAVTG